MSSGTIIIIILILVILVVAYIIGVIVRKRNESILATLEERKETLFQLPVSEEIETVKNLHLIGQSQVTFREWNQKWVDLSLNSFKDIENLISEAEGHNHALRFFKAKSDIDSIESQLHLIEEDIHAIREALTDLKAQEEKNSGRVKYALDLFENLQSDIKENEDKLGAVYPEIEAQLKGIEEEFAEFVALNSAGDPVEASTVLDQTENHMIALNQIVEKVPGIVEKLDVTFPEQLEDLETGYRKLLDENYQFTEKDIESRFRQIRNSIKSSLDKAVEFDLDGAEADNLDIADEIELLYTLFNREIKARLHVLKQVKTFPDFLAHSQENNARLADEVKRLSEAYLLSDAKIAKVSQLANSILKIEEETRPIIEDLEHPDKAYSKLENELVESFKALENIEEEQVKLASYLKEQEVSEAEARQKANNYVNRLHTIKRFMEKRNLPGIPSAFLSIFFMASDNLEELLDELAQTRIDMETVKRLSELADADMKELEETTYLLVERAILTEQLLQYSNRYRNHDAGVQQAFERSLSSFENDFNYETSFEEISYALELVEPGVTERFKQSYQKTKETIKY